MLLGAKLVSLTQRLGGRSPARAGRTETSERDKEMVPRAAGARRGEAAGGFAPGDGQESCVQEPQQQRPLSKGRSGKPESQAANKHQCRISLHRLNRSCWYHFVMQIRHYFTSPRRSVCGFLFPSTSECLWGGGKSLGHHQVCHYMASSEKGETWKVLVEFLNSTFGRGCWEVARMASL